jgi:hypothetical protein
MTASAMSDEELCPARRTTAAEHCWHDTGKMLMSNPPQSVDRCCWCGIERSLRVAVPIRSGEHGPMVPR